LKLLVVDDSLVVRNALSRWAVPSAGSAITEVVRAADGLEAVELFRSLRPELVTMDLTMPRLDGLGAIAALLELEPHTSILVISALNNHAAALEAIQRGACGFLTKPFTESEVRHALDRLVEHARQQPR
jgi:two-component system, chemotaxis family, chemotaxis protein CheY